MPMQPVKHTMKRCGLFGIKPWIPLTVIMSLTLPACMTLDKAVCFGTGTCDLNPKYQSATASRSVSPLPQTVITPVGNLIIVRDQGSGVISSVISVSGGK